jgi:hypothetical protein
VKLQQCTSDKCRWQSFDGHECCVLRHCRSSCKALFPACPEGAEPEIAFHWSLLYSACEELYKAQQWRCTWDRLCKSYEKHCEMPDSQLQALQKIHHHFRAAVMDFVDLQKLPYREVLSCRCPNKGACLVADGICLGPRLRNQYIVMPCHPPMADGTPLKHGSKHSDRMLIKNEKLRQLLFQLSLAEGQTVQDYVQLQELARQHCAPSLADCILQLTLVTGQPSDLVFLQDNRYFARDAVKLRRGVQPSAAQQLFHELGCNSPACSILRLKCCEQLQLWRQLVQQQLCTGDAQPVQIPPALEQLCPNLKWTFRSINRLLVQTTAGEAVAARAHSLCNALLVLLEHLETVCSAAWTSIMCVCTSMLCLMVPGSNRDCMNIDNVSSIMCGSLSMICLMVPGSNPSPAERHMSSFLRAARWGAFEGFWWFFPFKLHSSACSELRPKLIPGYGVGPGHIYFAFNHFPSNCSYFITSWILAK